MTPERITKIQAVANRRQRDLTVVLENVHDRHNIGAVLRTCDAVGIPEIFVLHTDPRLNQNQLNLGPGAASGALKWVDVHFFNSTEKCMSAVKKKYSSVIGTQLNGESKAIYEFDLTQPTAFIFGNEHAGITPEIENYIDHYCAIPQVGMVQSLNISVSCAVILYEAFRQRNVKGKYEGDTEQRDLIQTYTENSTETIKRKKIGVQ